MNRGRLALGFILSIVLLKFSPLQAVVIKQMQWMGFLSDYFAGQVVVGLKPNYSNNEFETLIQNVQGAKVDSIPNSRIYLISFNPERSIVKTIDNFKNSAIVEFVEPNMAYYLTQEQYQDSLWGFHNYGQSVNGVVGVPDVDADILEAWNIETGDTSVFISIIDSGIAMDTLGNLSHPDLNDTSRIKLDTLFNGSRLALRDLSGHGTGVLSVSAAKQDNLGIVGVAHGCKYLVTKADGASQDTSSSFHLGRAILHVCSLGVDIISESWHGAHSGLMERAVDTAYHRGVLLVGAAGNLCFPSSPLVWWPAAYAFWGTHAGHQNGYSNVISVGGIHSNDNPYGACSSDTLKIAVVGPSVNIFRAFPNYVSPYTSYVYSNGTSFSTPLTAGIAGLILSDAPNLTADSIRKIIQNTSDKIWHDPTSNAFNTAYLDSVWHKNYGFGRVNAHRALLRKVLTRPGILSITVQRDAADTSHWISATWADSSNDEASFKIYRRNMDAPAQDTLIDSVGANVNSYPDYAPQVGSQDYTYRVRAFWNNSGGFSKQVSVHNIPDKPIQNNPSVIFGTSAQCCGGFAMVPCNTKSNKVIVRWDTLDNQKPGTLAYWKIKVRFNDIDYWFTAPKEQTQEALCLWTSATCDFWVYAVDTTGAISNASNQQTVITGPCQICEPPANERVWLPNDQEDDDNFQTQELPKEFEIAQNYPNPFNLSTQINYALPRDAEVVITIYDILGRKVRFFDLGHQPAGYNSLTWDGKNDKGEAVSSGIYFYRLKAGNIVLSKRMTLLK